MYLTTEFNQSDKVYLLQTYVTKFSDILTQLSEEISKDPKLSNYDPLYCSIMTAIWGATSELAITCKTPEELYEVNTATLASLVDTSYLAYNLYNNEPENKFSQDEEDTTIKIMNNVKVTNEESIIPDDAIQNIENKQISNPYINSDNVEIDDITDENNIDNETDKVEVLSYSIQMDDDDD